MSDLELGTARTRVSSRLVLQRTRQISRSSILTRAISSLSSHFQRRQKEALAVLPVRGVFTIIWLQQDLTLSIR